MNERTFHARNAGKLDDPERLAWLPPGKIISVLGLHKGMTVADIGAGTGYFAIPMAEKLGSEGKVLAVDIQQEMLALLRDKLRTLDSGLNIQSIHGEAADTTLAPQTVDVVFMANVWHELDDHRRVLREARRILRPDGRLVILDWRTDVSHPPGPPPDHRIPVDAVAEVLQENRWDLLRRENVGTYSYLIQSVALEP